VRCATALVAAAAILGSTAASVGATPRSGAETLGHAYAADRRGDRAGALALAADLDAAALRNPDYADYVLAQAAALTGDHAAALTRFHRLAGRAGARFAAVAAWRVADCLWHLGRLDAASKAYAQRLAAPDEDSRAAGDAALARFRIAEAHARRGRRARALAGFRDLWMRHPAHPLAATARDRAWALGGDAAVTLSASDRVERADRLTVERRWQEAVAELDQVGDDVPLAVRRRRDFQLGRTLFKMRRQYRLAGDLLLSVYPHVGADRDWALFHGARGLSRAHFDEEAIQWYEKLVAQVPRSRFAAEAQYLCGWLKFNVGKFREALPGLEETRRRYPRSPWADMALWYLAFSHYLLGEHEAALPLFEELARKSGRLVEGKGRYWRARTLDKLERGDEATAAYRALVGRFPLSWYALLARARLAERDVSIGPFGDDPRSPDDVPALAEAPGPKVAADPLLGRVDELVAAGLPDEAAVELRRGERAFLARHGHAVGLAAVLDVYRRAGNFNRPWMLAVVHGGDRALDAEPQGRARRFWEHAYPLAYRELVEAWREVGPNPPYYLYAIMRKESGFDPHVVSYADALGLLQMIPPTTQRVAQARGVEYTPDLLFDPTRNIEMGSWYIGRLLAKFKGQIPIGAAAYNAGPTPVMRWLDSYGDRPMDEYVELVSFTQAREYGKKVTESYARYLYLYASEIYEQPLTVDPAYVADELTY
jgi:soluble lytic murein transglycosylase